MKNTDMIEKLIHALEESNLALSAFASHPAYGGALVERMKLNYKLILVASTRSKIKVVR